MWQPTWPDGLSMWTLTSTAMAGAIMFWSAALWAAACTVDTRSPACMDRRKTIRRTVLTVEVQCIHIIDILHLRQSASLVQTSPRQLWSRTGSFRCPNQVGQSMLIHRSTLQQGHKMVMNIFTIANISMNLNPIQYANRKISTSGATIPDMSLVLVP